MNIRRQSFAGRRFLAVLAAVLWTLAVVWIAVPHILFGTAHDPLDALANFLCVALIFLGGFNFVLYVIGFLRARARAQFLEGQAPGVPDLITTRTAIVMPVYHEDMARVSLGLEQTWRSAQKAGLAPHLDFYLLCDSVNPAAREAEDRAFQRLAPIFHSIHGGTGDPPVRSGDSPLGTPHDSESEVPPAGRLFLIRRENRQKFKAGNIAHFLETHGHAYDFMLVLDADSVMTGAKIRRLITQLQARPKTALIQTLMFPIRSRTLFARAMQFGIARSLPIFGHGMAWFFGRESVYWGHNALIRVHPFMAHCNLPIMPGEPPLGGDIMSHDIVEAALLGRAGWSIDWDLEPGGSFDELPANILTYGQRDRRWCQGNFQHFWLAFGDGMKFGHRFYLAGGILGYLMGPLLLLLAVIGFVQGLRGRVYDPTTVMVASFIFFLFVLTTVPKVLGYFALPRAQRRPWPELLSGFIDLVVSFIMSWALFYLHTQFVIGLLCGRMVPWVSQSRNPEEGVEWRTAARLFWLPTVLGLLWLWAAWRYTPSFIIFLIPILIGWILSIPMAVLTSSAALGDWFARRGLLRDNLSPADIAELGPLHEESGGSRQLLDPDNPIPARPIPTTS